MIRKKRAFIDFYRGKKILLTGGGGYIGKLLIERLLQFDPEVIRVFENNEWSLFNLRQKYPGEGNGKLRFLLGDIRNLNRLQYAFRGIDIVFHLASYKHVPECEYNPLDAVENNITGTANVIQAAIEKNVKKVFFTSTDKAANPSNTMGATKLLAEKLMTAATTYGAYTTIFACCRFGNVFGSSGSVAPLFEEQIASGKEITITDPGMTRFVITKDRAIDLLLNSCYLAEGGEIFIFKMPVINVNDLADVMIEKYGVAKKVIIGRRAGEKLYEELMTDEEKSRAYEGEDMYIVFSQLQPANLNNYHGYKKVKHINNSSQMKLLSKKEISSMLE